MKTSVVSWMGVVAISVTGLAALTPERGAAQTTLGIVAGVNLASFDDIQVGNVRETFDSRTGFHAGLFLDAAFGPMAVRPGIQYLNAGPLFEGATFLDPDAFQLNYIAVPIDVRAQLISLLVAPYVFTGPEFRILASSDAQSDFEDDLENFVMVWSVGAGVKLGFLYPELRYTFDISGITPDQFTVGGVNVVTNQATVNSFRLSLGMGF